MGWRLSLLLGVLGLAAAAASPARASCSGPPGEAGVVYFNQDYNMLQYCDDTSWVPMYFNDYRANGVHFDNSTYLSGGDLSSVSDGRKMTLSFWVRRTGDFGVTNDTFNIGGAGNFRLYFNTGNKLRLTVDNPGGTVVLDVSSNTSFADTSWHHVLLSVDMGSTGSRKLYIDGAADSASWPTYTHDDLNYGGADANLSVSTSSTNLNGDIADFWIALNTYIDLSDANELAKFIDVRGKPVNLGPDGSRVTGAPPDIFLSGDTASWHTNKGTGGGFTENGALTDAVSDPGGDIASGLVAHWTLDTDPETDPISGVTANPNSGATMVQGKIGNAVQFTGSTGTRVSLGSTVIDATLPYTIAAWVYLYSKPGTNRTYAVYSPYNHGGPTGYVFRIGQYTVANDSRLNLYTWDGAANEHFGTTQLNTGQWYHIALTYDGDTTLSFYVDGAPDGKAAYTPPADGIGVAGHIGHSTNTGNGYTMNGRIDDVRLYDRALDPVDIAQLAGCASPAGIAGTMLYNQDAHVMQFCDGRDWLAMGPEGDGDAGGGCTGPAGVEGGMIYNIDWKTLQYCEGDQWIAIGKGCRDAPGAVCEDGTVYAGLSPDGNMAMYTTPGDHGNESFNRGVTATVASGVTNATTGETNTAALAVLADADSPYDAAIVCHDLVAHGHDDWYLPARNELQVLYDNHVAIGNFTTSNSSASRYWSSTESTLNSGRHIWFYDGSSGNNNKSGNLRMRCVRK